MLRKPARGRTIGIDKAAQKGNQLVAGQTNCGEYDDGEPRRGFRRQLIDFLRRHHETDPDAGVGQLLSNGQARKHMPASPTTSDRDIDWIAGERHQEPLWPAKPGTGAWNGLWRALEPRLTLVWV